MDDQDGELIDRIYEAGANPELWPSTLDQLEDFARAGAGILTCVAGNKVHFLGSQRGIELAEAWAAFSGDALASNVRTAGLLKSDYPGFLTDRDVVAEADIDHDPLYRDFLRPSGYGFCTACMVTAPGGDRFIFHFERRLADGPVTAEVRARLDELRGHLSRAALLSARLDFLRMQAATEAMARVNLAAAAVTVRRRIVSANAPFECLMPNTVRDCPSGFVLTSPVANRLVMQAIEGTGRPGSHEVRSIPVAATEADPAMVVHVMPVRRTAHDIFAGADALLVVTPVRPGNTPDAELLHGLFDLTPAEILVARGIARGQTLAEIAAERNVQRTTIRNQLGGVFTKTGTSRQADLVSLLRAVAS